MHSFTSTLFSHYIYKIHLFFCMYSCSCHLPVAIVLEYPLYKHTAIYLSNSTPDRYLNYFQFLAIKSKTSRQRTNALIFVQVIPNNEIDGSYGKYIFSHSKYSPYHFSKWITSIYSLAEISDSFSCSISSILSTLVAIILGLQYMTLWLCFYFTDSQCFKDSFHIINRVWICSFGK